MFVKHLFRWLSALLLLALVYGGLTHGEQLTNVLVAPLPGAEEVQDALGGQPDWRLDVQVGSSWEKLSTFDDQEFGESLSWDLSTPLPMHKIGLMRLVEDDMADDDIIEEVEPQGDSFEGSQYRYELTTARRPLAGVLWYITHWPGAALAGLLVVSLILSFFRPWSVALFAAESAASL